MAGTRCVSLRAMVVIVLMCAASVGSGAASAQADDVVLRRGEMEPMRGTVVAVDDAGVSVRSEFGAMHLVPWDRVREVQTEQPLPQIRRYEQTAVDLWRARSRVERNDLAMAEPLLEALFEAYRGRRHETALVVAEGLLRCRLARGAQAMAVVPSLEAIRLRRSGVDTASYAMLDAVIDESTWLCVHLPPSWPASANMRRLIADLDRYDAQGDALVDEMATLYRLAALRAVGETIDDDDDLGDGRSARFLRRIVDAIAAANGDSDDAAAQRSAVESLTGSLDELVGWQEAWARYAIGRALMRDDDDAQQRMGLVHLAHVPARFSRSQPFLAGLAAVELAEAVADRGEVQAAASVRSQIEQLYPNHPAIDTVR